jgi:hypothetical protein
MKSKRLSNLMVPAGGSAYEGVLKTHNLLIFRDKTLLALAGDNDTSQLFPHIDVDGTVSDSPSKCYVHRCAQNKHP